MIREEKEGRGRLGKRRKEKERGEGRRERCREWSRLDPSIIFKNTPPMT